MLCYNFCRCSQLFNKQISEETLLQSVFLCEENPHAILEKLQPSLNEQIHLPIEEKLAILQLEAFVIFPFSKLISPQLDSLKLSLSLLSQPHLYIRARPGRKEVVIKRLEELQIEIVEQVGNCISLQNGTSLNELQGVNKDFVVQDASSQKVFDGLGLTETTNKIDLWDCCAASGGKSILFADTIGRHTTLTVSDIRDSMLRNCKNRLAQAHIRVQKFLQADLEKQGIEVDVNFDYIICDAPCTGSGTWARTPEQLYFFQEKHIAEYQKKQIAIAKNALQSLASAGKFIYITCSVFAAENEAVVSILEKEGQYKCTSQQYYSGAGQKADTLFVAVLEHS